MGETLEVLQKEHEKLDGDILDMENKRGHLSYEEVLVLNRMKKHKLAVKDAIYSYKDN